MATMAEQCDAGDGMQCEEQMGEQHSVAAVAPDEDVSRCYDAHPAWYAQAYAATPAMQWQPSMYAQTFDDHVHLAVQYAVAADVYGAPHQVPQGADPETGWPLSAAHLCWLHRQYARVLTRTLELDRRENLLCRRETAFTNWQKSGYGMSTDIASAPPLPPPLPTNGVHATQTAPTGSSGGGGHGAPRTRGTRGGRNSHGRNHAAPTSSYA